MRLFLYNRDPRCGRLAITASLSPGPDFASYLEEVLVSGSSFVSSSKAKRSPPASVQILKRIMLGASASNYLAI